MKRMKTIFLMIFILVFVSTTFGQAEASKMKSLLKGEDLKQWNVPKNNIWWSVSEGVLLAKSDPDKKGSTLWTKKKYTDFVVQMDFKFVDGTIDSGIFMRGEDEENPQIQIGISGSLKRDMTGSPYVPGAGYPVEAKGVKELLKQNDWNTLKASAIGNVYKVWLNGQEVMDYTLDNANLKGPVGLQLHPGNEMSIRFKNIQIKEL